MSDKFQLETEQSFSGNHKNTFDRFAYLLPSIINCVLCALVVFGIFNPFFQVLSFRIYVFGYLLLPLSLHIWTQWESPAWLLWIKWLLAIMQKRKQRPLRTLSFSFKMYFSLFLMILYYHNGNVLSNIRVIHNFSLFNIHQFLDTLSYDRVMSCIAV